MPNICPGPHGFHGTIVGYGHATLKGVQGFNIDAAGICGSKDNVRRFLDSSGWLRVPDGDNATVYFNSWTFGFFEPCKYEGATPGDSGGPLLDDSGDICGVGGEIALPFVGPFYYQLDNVYAGIDSPAVINLFQNGKAQTQFGPTSAIDPHGQWLGECEDFKKSCVNWLDCSSGDADGDLVMDKCDSCPTIFNPDQLTYNDDPDGNGWGEACDFCPGVDYSFGARNLTTADNANYEIELAEAYPGQTEPFAKNGGILLGPKTAAFNTAQAAYLAAFHPNECDPTGAKAPADDLSDYLSC